MFGLLATCVVVVVVAGVVVVVVVAVAVAVAVVVVVVVDDGAAHHPSILYIYAAYDLPMPFPEAESKASKGSQSSFTSNGTARLTVTWSFRTGRPWCGQLTNLEIFLGEIENYNLEPKRKVVSPLQTLMVHGIHRISTKALGDIRMSKVHSSWLLQTGFLFIN